MTTKTTAHPTINIRNLPPKLRRFFDLCCTKAGVQATSRQLSSYIRGTGSAAAYALRTGGRVQIHRTARHFGRQFSKVSAK